ncbi:MAG: hypothetical protein HY316_10245 [Acidobacteria bacterium]|nr:hypothetical protein [Acidobacteriota bacterium]
MTGHIAHLLRSRKVVLAAMLAIFAVMAGAVSFMGENTTGQLVLQKATEIGRLTSYEPLPEMDGQMCEWVPASASSSLAAALRQEQLSARTAVARAAVDEAQRAEVAKRKQVRMIRDPYAAFTSVAVDLANNEVVMTDENLHSLVVYDRLTNTPPSATMSEPKRRIMGEKSRVNYPCGVYVDPKTGDTYIIPNDTADEMLVFARGADGNVPAQRKLNSPHGTYAIAVDEAAEEMFFTIQHDSAISVFRKMAAGDEAPIRLLQGGRTRLADPHGIAVDNKNNLMYVTNWGSWHQVDPAAIKLPSTGFLGPWLDRDKKGKANWPLGLNYSVPGSGKSFPPSITVYSKTAKGDTPPLRVIEGPKTQMNWPSGIAVDPERDELYVANDIGDSILVFKASASGDVAPIRVLKGPKTLIKNPTGVFLDTKNNELWVSNFGNRTATVYKPTASGDTSPLRVIRSGPLDVPAPRFSNPFSNAYDSKREQILVPN